MGLLDISHDAFGRIRLVDYLPADIVVEFDGWEYLDRLWLGESWGAFTEWLRLESDPEVLRSVALDLSTLPAMASAAMLAMLALPLRFGMTLEEVVVVLGQPTESFGFVADRTTYVWYVNTVDAYAVGCTVHDALGLIYLTVHTTPLPE